LLKLGIYRLDQFHPGPAPGPLAQLRSALSRNRIAFTLLRTDVPATPKQIQLFEHVIPQVLLSSGVYRTTFRGRFRNLNGFLNERIANHFEPAAPLRIEDWAASDCLTSSEWAASLLTLLPNATVTASDLTLFLVEARLPNGSSYVLEANGAPLQYIQPPFVIRLSPSEPAALPVNSFLEKRARARLQSLRATWRIPEAWLSSEGSEPFNQGPYVFSKIPLIHPDAQSLRHSSDRFSIRRHSVFEPSAQWCDVIRTMNIFNLAYFSKERLLEGARAVARSLPKGGVWIVGRTFQENPPDHNASIFVKEDAGFRLLDRYGKGSEIEDLVLSS
jgi:hypothetical protein